MPTIKCSYCGGSFYRDLGRVNESNKFGWNSFCALECQYSYRTTSINCVCSRPNCRKTFRRRKRAFHKSRKHYCSQRCAAIVNNSVFPKRKALVKVCRYCRKEYKGGAKKYCSTTCQYGALSTPPDRIIRLITRFVRKNGRIPTKREFPHYRAIRSKFGTWNKAVRAAGFEPNPVMFAKKYIANDGHRCDSLAEKIIDDWLYSRDIKHKVNYSYPGDHGMTSDFKVGVYWVEFFGLSGQHKKYDELKEKKLKLVWKNNLKLIEVYPRHLFPTNKLNKVLGVLKI